MEYLVAKTLRASRALVVANYCLVVNDVEIILKTVIEVVMLVVVVVDDQSFHRFSFACPRLPKIYFLLEKLIEINIVSKVPS
jgi:hypothetical protein